MIYLICFPIEIYTNSNNLKNLKGNIIMGSVKEVTVVELNRIAGYPPVQNLIKILLKKGYKVNFIGGEVSNISDDIKCNDNFCSIETSLYDKTSSIYKRIKNRIHIIWIARKSLKKCMETSNILWTTSMFTTSIVGKQATNYKTVLQLMELDSDTILKYL